MHLRIILRIVVRDRIKTYSFIMCIYDLLYIRTRVDRKRLGNRQMEISRKTFLVNLHVSLVDPPIKIPRL